MDSRLRGNDGTIAQRATLIQQTNQSRNPKSPKANDGTTV
jgi:hypothetical protein